MRLRRIIVAFLVLVLGSLVTTGCASFVTKVQRASEDCMLRNIKEACAYVYAVGTRSAVETKVGGAIATEGAAEAGYNIYLEGGSIPSSTQIPAKTPTLTPTPTPSFIPNPNTTIIP